MAECTNIKVVNCVKWYKMQTGSAEGAGTYDGARHPGAGAYYWPHGDVTYDPLYEQQGIYTIADYGNRLKLMVGPAGADVSKITDLRYAGYVDAPNPNGVMSHYTGYGYLAVSHIGGKWPTRVPGDPLPETEVGGLIIAYVYLTSFVPSVAAYDKTIYERVKDDVLHDMITRGLAGLTVRLAQDTGRVESRQYRRNGWCTCGAVGAASRGRAAGYRSWVEATSDINAPLQCGGPWMNGTGPVTSYLTEGRPNDLITSVLPEYVKSDMTYGNEILLDNIWRYAPGVKYNYHGMYDGTFYAPVNYPGESVYASPIPLADWEYLMAEGRLWSVDDANRVFTRREVQWYG